MERIIRHNYCEDYLKSFKNSSCKLEFKYGREILRTDNFEITIFDKGLKLNCLNQSTEKINLLKLSDNVIDKRLNSVHINCESIYWPSARYLDYLGISDISKLLIFFTKKSIEFDITEISGKPIQNSKLDIHLSGKNDQSDFESLSNEVLTNYSEISSVFLWTFGIRTIPTTFFTRHFPNVLSIKWETDGCLLTIDDVVGLKQLDSMDYVLNTIEFSDACTKLNFNKNMSELRSLRIGIKPYSRPIPNEAVYDVDRDFLMGVPGLETFKFSGIQNVSFPSTIFRAQQNLTTLVLGNIDNLTDEHFRYLINLKSLELNDVGSLDLILRSRTLQNNLEEIALQTNRTHLTVSRFRTFRNLKKITVRCHETKCRTLQCRALLGCVLTLETDFTICRESCKCWLNQYHPSQMWIDCSYRNLSYLRIDDFPNNTVYLDISHNQLTKLKIEQLPPNLLYLDISNNYLRALDIKQLPLKLEHLNLRDNYLKSINIVQEKRLEKFKYFDLSNNKLQTLGEGTQNFILTHSDTQINLSNNAWNCDCYAKKFLNFIQVLSQNVDLSQVYCRNRDLGPLIDVNVDDICVSGSTIAIIVLGTLLLVTTLAAFAIYYKRGILFWMYEHNICHGLSRQHKKFDSEKKYDAFLAYSSADSKLIPEFVDRLEKGSPKWRLLFYERNWPVGEVISDLILHSVEISKRTIILMTNNFLKSDWARFELLTAIKATSKDKTMRLIVIMYPDVENTKPLGREINDYLIFTTYLKSNDPNFWNKLFYAMPHDTSEREEVADEFELMQLPR